MDEQWLREWSAEECENPPKHLRREVGELLAALDYARRDADDMRPSATRGWELAIELDAARTEVAALRAVAEAFADDTADVNDRAEVLRGFGQHNCADLRHARRSAEIQQ